MPGKNDDDQRDDQNLEGDEPEEEEDDDTAAEGDDGDGDGADGDKPAGKKPLTGDAKRIADLQSKADKAEARANAAEKALKAAKQGGGGGGDPATQALMAELREASLDAVFGEFPQLRDYSIDRSLIEGASRAELREKATELVGLIKSIETKVRNKVLADNGIVAPATGDKVRKAVDYATMSDEDFEKVLNSVS